jgi:hypothetical protein
MKTLLIGQAPGPNTDPDFPLFPLPRTSAGGRLQRFLGMTRSEYLKTFDRVNLLPYFPGRTQKRDDAFPIPAARMAAQILRPMLRSRRVVLVGRKVADAFGLDPKLPWMTPTLYRCGPRSMTAGCKGLAEMMVIPHPSGRNHWYNNPDNQLLLAEGMGAFIRKSREDAELSCLLLQGEAEECHQE